MSGPPTSGLPRPRGGPVLAPWEAERADRRVCRSIVYLEIDNRQCVQSSVQCFQSATDVAAFLGALASLGSLSIPYKIEAVQSEWHPCPDAGAPSSPGPSRWAGVSSESLGPVFFPLSVLNK